MVIDCFQDREDLDEELGVDDDSRYAELGDLVTIEFRDGPDVHRNAIFIRSLRAGEWKPNDLAPVTWAKGTLTRIPTSGPAVLAITSEGIRTFPNLGWRVTIVQRLSETNDD